MLPKFLRCYVIFNYSYRFVKREEKKSIKKILKNMFCTLSIEKYREYNSMFFDKRWYKDTSLLIAIVPCHHSQRLCKYIKMYINKYCYKIFMDKIFRL